LVGKLEEKRALGRARCTKKDNIKTDFQEVWRGRKVDWSGSEQGQVAGSCECGNETLCFVKCGEFLYYLRTC
jgi:hypothetical protein